MTTSATGRKLTDACNGVTTTFSCPSFLTSGDLKVYLLDDPADANSAGTLLSEGGDYTVDGGLGGTGLATITTTVAYPLGKYLRRWRQTSRKQDVQIVAGQGVPAATQEAALDRLSMIDEEHDDDFARAVSTPPGEAGQVLPSRAELAGKFLVGDGAGNLVPADGSGADGALRADLAADGGDGLVRVKRADAGAVARTLQSKLRDFAHWRDFGILGDGSDETAALNYLIASVNANAGCLHLLPPTRVGYSAPLTSITVDNFWIEGAGAREDLHDIGAVVMTGTVLKWIGGASPGVTGLKVEPVSGAGNQRLSGGFLRYVGFDGSGNLGTNLSVKSMEEGEIDVATMNATVTGVYLGVVPLLGEARDLNRNNIRIKSRQVEVKSAYAVTLDGDANANVSMNRIEIDAQTTDKAALLSLNSDNNRYPHIRINKHPEGIATYGIELRGGATAQQSARDEVIEFYSANVPAFAQGTGGGVVVASKGNVIRRSDAGNNTPNPTLGTGAIIAVENVWQTYVPAVASATGALTTAVGTGEFLRRDGDLVEWAAQATITNNGTGATALRVDLPFPAAANNFHFPVRCLEISGTSLVLYAEIAPGGTYATIVLAGGGYPGANGRTFAISGVYRAAA